jgi:hypothetical protein
MNTVERGAAVVSVIVVVFSAGVAWDSLSNRIDKVDEKIGAIQKTLGSTPCTAILNRQLAAIDKGKADVRRALDGLSNQYGCVSALTGWAPAGATADAVEMNVTDAHLAAQLNAVDVVLNKDH